MKRFIIVVTTVLSGSNTIEYYILSVGLSQKSSKTNRKLDHNDKPMTIHSDDCKLLGEYFANCLPKIMMSILTIT